MMLNDQRQATAICQLDLLVAGFRSFDLFVCQFGHLAYFLSGEPHTDPHNGNSGRAQVSLGVRKTDASKALFTKPCDCE